MVPKQLTGETGTSQRTSSIYKVQTYQNFTTVKNGHIKKDCRKRIREEKSSNYKNEDNKNKWNYWKVKNHEVNYCYNNKGSEIESSSKLHIRSNLRRYIYHENFKPKQWQQDIFYGFRYHVTHDLFQPKTSIFSTRALIWLHFKTVNLFLRPIFSLFSHLNSALHHLVIEFCSAIKIFQKYCTVI